MLFLDADSRLGATSGWYIAIQVTREFVLIDVIFSNLPSLSSNIETFPSESAAAIFKFDVLSTITAVLIRLSALNSFFKFYDFIKNVKNSIIKKDSNEILEVPLLRQFQHLKIGKRFS